MKITILGCGSSGGVPLITGEWGVCDSHNSRNRRRRSSILVTYENHHILIDTSPDLRQQLLDVHVTHLDAVLYTHAHADHINGLDELRPFSYTQKQPIPVYGDSQTLNDLQSTFDHAFSSTSPFYAPFVKAHEINGPFDLFGLTICPFPQDHVTLTSWGYRIGNMAYSTDFKSIPQESLDLLKDIDLWIIDCLRFEEHPTHSHFEATINLIQQVKPKKAILTHMNHHFDYDVALSQCPPGVEPAYDGMILQVINQPMST